MHYTLEIGQSESFWATFESEMVAQELSKIAQSVVNLMKHFTIIIYDSRVV